MAKWRDQFLAGGLEALQAGASRGPSVREAQLEPGTNGVIERCYEAIKYEHLYLREIADGQALAAGRRLPTRLHP